MPGLVEGADRETVKRAVPKPANKIQAVAVAKLYVAYPDRSRWTYTGLQGAAVLSNDLVGNTFWIKLVDVSPANRGVLWDQEIYDTFAYNQDRTFFHSFEMEQCLAGLSFVDEKEARTFKKKMDEREKNASKNTKAQPFGSNNAGGAVPVSNGTKSHSRLGGFTNLLHGYRHSSNPSLPQPAPSYVYPAPTSFGAPVSNSRPSSSKIDIADPTWRPILDELLEMGITEDQIDANADFIRDYVAQKQAAETAQGIASAMNDTSRSRAAPPPPPPPSSAPFPRLSPQNTGSTTASRRGPPPAPPPSRRPVGGRAPSPPKADSPSPDPSPPTTPQPQFRVPPPFADAGKFAVADASMGRPRASSGANLANPGPPPPPRPPKTPIEEEGSSSGFRVPPPFTGDRKVSVPPPPPGRAAVPPPTPARDAAAAPPPLPPKTPQGAHSIAPASIPPPPPPPPNRNNAPPLPSLTARPTPPPPSVGNHPPPPPPIPSSSGPPPPPPMPSSGGLPPPPPPMPSSGGLPPPPPPMPSSGGPPPPPPPPPGSGAAPPLPKVGGRDDLLSAIRLGGPGGLRRVSSQEKRDRSAAAVPGSEPSAATSGSTAPAAGDAGGGLAGALAAALSQRKKKVASGSDDEKEDDDDW